MIPDRGPGRLFLSHQAEVAKVVVEGDFFKLAEDETRLEYPREFLFRREVGYVSVTGFMNSWFFPNRGSSSLNMRTVSFPPEGRRDGSRKA